MLRAPEAATRGFEPSRGVTTDGAAGNGSALVQARPSLGSLPRVKRGPITLLRAAVDLLAASVALAAVLLESGSPAWPAIPIAPLVLVGLFQLAGLYGQSDPLESGKTSVKGGPFARRLLTSATFAWAASLLVVSPTRHWE